MGNNSRPFRARIEIIGVNPFVYLPDDVLENLFISAGRDRGPIPVRMAIDGHEFPQTLVKYAGQWRLYLNQPMRTAAGKETGDEAKFEVWFDPAKREIEPHPKLLAALAANPASREVFERLPPSRRLEIVRYIGLLKSEESVERNVARAISFLTGGERFVGREKP